LHNAEKEHEIWDDIKLDVHQRMAILKIRVETDSLPPSEIFRQEEIKYLRATQDVHEAASALPQLATVRSSLYKRKLKVLPKIPSSIDEFDLSTVDLITVVGKRLLIDDFTIEKTKQGLLSFYNSLYFM